MFESLKRGTVCCYNSKSTIAVEISFVKHKVFLMELIFCVQTRQE